MRAKRYLAWARVSSREQEREGFSLEIQEDAFVRFAKQNKSKPRFTQSKVYRTLTDRSYLGEIRFRNEWHRGTHQPLIDQETFDHAQARLGDKIYRSHRMVYAGGLILCGHCSRPITGEPKFKTTKSGIRSYVYYRCSQYNVREHPRIRVTEASLEQQVLNLVDRLERRSFELADWMSLVVRDQLKADLSFEQGRIAEAKRHLSLIDGLQDELLNLRIAGKVDQFRYDAKCRELEERSVVLRKQLAESPQLDVSIEKRISQAGSLFKMIRCRWPIADYRFKRRVLETLFGRLRLFKDELRPDNRTPFELLLAG